MKIKMLHNVLQEKLELQNKITLPIAGALECQSSFIIIKYYFCDIQYSLKFNVFDVTSFCSILLLSSVIIIN